ncbi:MAG: carboxyl-terminal protease [Verrucomicrobiales bacterium]|nr:carboxyl-terminal protease [Verrucomicrobiales bacterium]
MNSLQCFRAVTLGILLSISGAHAASTNDVPKFDELLKLLREHGSLSPAELDRAAATGLLSSLHGQVVLVTNVSANSLTNLAPLVRSTNYDNGFAYFRVGQVKSDLSEQIAKKFKELSSAGKIKGVVLDLRFAGGDDYAVAAAVADLFLSEEQPLLSWGTASAKATAKTNAINLPVTVLVNKQTSGAAEALAAVLRETQVALLIGSQTEGSASIFDEFSLPSGQRVRVAVAQVKVGKDKPASADGLKPDIEVDVKPEDEKAFLDDPYKPLAKVTPSTTSTNATASLARTNQPRLNEAELVRQHREGFNLRDQVADKPSKEMEDAMRSMNDIALMRALDLLKGLAVVQQTRH